MQGKKWMKTLQQVISIKSRIFDVVGLMLGLRLTCKPAMLISLAIIILYLDDLFTNKIL